MPKLETLLSIESDMTAIECALVASLIAVFIFVAFQLIGADVSNVFNEVGTTLK